MHDYSIHKPAYHFMPPQNWMNDPNGPIWFKGYYHIFYQHNPRASVWDTMHWGHARSLDLIHWEHLPIALSPDPKIPEEHCFSGCTVLDGDIPTILYSSIEKGKNQRQWATIRLARSYDGMESWVREPEPVLTQDIHTERVGEWRDPFVWKEDGIWNMLVGGEAEGYGHIFLYRSENLLEWEYICPFYSDNNAPFLECPNLLRFGDKSVLIYSPNAEVMYHVGHMTDDGHFESVQSGIMDYGKRKGFYAPNTILNDPNGRYLTWGWLPDDFRELRNIPNYCGALSLPRELSLDNDGQFKQTPARELMAMRGKCFEQAYTNISDFHEKIPFKGRNAEIELLASYNSNTNLSFDIYCSPDDTERTRIHISSSEECIKLERSLTSLSNRHDKNFLSAPLFASDSKLWLRIFLDNSAIEIYCNESRVISSRLYPQNPDSQEIWIGGDCDNVAIKIWPMIVNKE